MKIYVITKSSPNHGTNSTLRKTRYSGLYVNPKLFIKNHGTNSNLRKTRYSGLYVNPKVLIKAFQNFLFIAFKQLSQNHVM